MLSSSNMIDNFFKSFDLFGKQYSFQERNKKNYNTIVGGVLTSILLICVSVIGFMIGKEIYERQTPIVVSSYSIITPQETDIKLIDVPIILTFHNYDGSAVKDINGILDFESVVFDNSHKFEITIKAYEGFVNCEHEKFGQHKDWVEKTVKEAVDQGHTPKCLNINDSFHFKNSYGSPDGTFLNYQIKMCDSTKKGRNCNPDVINLTSQIYVHLRTLNSYVDPKDYSNPVKYYLESNMEQVGNQFLKRTFLRYSQNTLITDSGWIFENKSHQKYISLKDTKQSINPTYDGYMYWITLESPSIIISSIRSYLKIQEFFAKVGGLYNALFIVLSFITSDYLKFSFLKHIYTIFKNTEKISISNVPKINNIIKAIPYKHLLKENAEIPRTMIKVDVRKFDSIQPDQSASELNIFRQNPSTQKSQISYYDYLCSTFFFCGSKSTTKVQFKEVKLISVKLISFETYIRIVSDYIKNQFPLDKIN